MEDWKSLRAKAIEMKHAFLDLADTLDLCVMELVQISIELREKDESKKTKSKAGDLLRKLAEDLNQVIESTASQDTDSFLGPWG
nr:hypothetical protein BaRGS_005136 [Batillaria attramentaria]